MWDRLVGTLFDLESWNIRARSESELNKSGASPWIKIWANWVPESEVVFKVTHSRTEVDSTTLDFYSYAFHAWVGKTHLNYVCTWVSVCLQRPSFKALMLLCCPLVTKRKYCSCRTRSGTPRLHSFKGLFIDVY